MSTLQALLTEADFHKKKISSPKSETEDIIILNKTFRTCHGTALNLMTELTEQEEMNITEETIKALHRLLCEDLGISGGGQYRTTDALISRTGETAAAPMDIPRLASHLADQIYSSQTTLHPIELAAMAHKRLVDIHPFSDGNFMTASLLMNLILIHSGYCVIEIPAFQENEYKEALMISRQFKDMEPFSKLVAKWVIQTEKELCGQ